MKKIRLSAALNCTVPMALAFLETGFLENRSACTAHSIRPPKNLMKAAQKFELQKFKTFIKQVKTYVD